MKLKIMTFNVQHMRDFHYKDKDNIDFEFFGSYIRSKSPDIIGLNEVRNAGESERYVDQVGIVGGIAGMEHRFFAEAIKVGGKNPYGNGMLSGHPFEAQVVPIPDPDDRKAGGTFESRCVLKASFVFEGKTLTVLSTHFGLNPSEAINAAKTVCDIADSTDGPMILMGDFNLTPESPILDPIRQRFQDTEHMIPGDGNHYTYPSDAPTGKIDYIFTRGIDVSSADINRDIVSDHYSLTATIEL